MYKNYNTRTEKESQLKNNCKITVHFLHLHPQGVSELIMKNIRDSNTFQNKNIFWGTIVTILNKLYSAFSCTILFLLK